MMDRMQDPIFWYAVAFIIFLAVAFIFARKPTISWLDEEIAKVRKELDQARQLRAEAETTLAEYTKKQAEALAEAEQIVKNAQEEAAEVKTKAEADLQAALERHEKQAMSRIRMAETEAVTQIRNATIELAMQMVRKTLADQVDDVTAAKLVDKAIDELPSNGNKTSKKAKAA